MPEKAAYHSLVPACWPTAGFLPNANVQTFFVLIASPEVYLGPGHGFNCHLVPAF